MLTEHSEYRNAMLLLYGLSPRYAYMLFKCIDCSSGSSPIAVAGQVQPII